MDLAAGDSSTDQLRRERGERIGARVRALATWTNLWSVAFFVTLVLVHFTPPRAMGSIHLDDSWQQAYPYFHERGFQAGLDYVFTYGPLAHLDIGHFSAAGHDPVSFFREHHERIVSLHVKDRDRDAERTYRHFGEGATPIAEVLKLAKQLGFRYAANIEYELEEENPTEGVRRSLAYMRRALA